jgi:small subunit ribosomal protein S16
MATRIRLQRHGRKGKAFFHIVAADSRAKRDGKYIEKLGVYNPNTNPATIDINFDSTLKWVQVGAEMTDTARAILSYKGVLYKNHLLNGVKKGAFSTEEAEKRFAAWQAEKESKITGKVDNLAKNAAQEKAARLKAEEESNSARAAAIEAKNAPEVVEEEVVEAPETVEAAADDAPASDESSVAEEAPSAEEVASEEAPAGEESSEEEKPAE